MLYIPSLAGIHGTEYSTVRHARPPAIHRSGQGWPLKLNKVAHHTWEPTTRRGPYRSWCTPSYNEPTHQCMYCTRPKKISDPKVLPKYRVLNDNMHSRTLSAGPSISSSGHTHIGTTLTVPAEQRAITLPAAQSANKPFGSQQQGATVGVLRAEPMYVHCM